MAKYFEEAPSEDPVALMDQILASASDVSYTVVSEFGHHVLGLAPDCTTDEVLRECRQLETGMLDRLLEDLKPEPSDGQAVVTAEQSHFEVYPKKVHYPRRSSARDDGFDVTEHHWRFRDADGRVIAESGGAGYSSPDAAERGIGVFLESLDAFDWSGEVVKPPVVYRDIDDV